MVLPICSAASASTCRHWSKTKVNYSKFDWKGESWVQSFDLDCVGSISAIPPTLFTCFIEEFNKLAWWLERKNHDRKTRRGGSNFLKEINQTKYTNLIRPVSLACQRNFRASKRLCATVSLCYAICPSLLLLAVNFVHYDIFYHIHSIIVLDQANKHFNIVSHLDAISVCNWLIFILQARCQIIFRTATINHDIDWVLLWKWSVFHFWIWSWHSVQNMSTYSMYYSIRMHESKKYTTFFKSERLQHSWTKQLQCAQLSITKRGDLVC